MKKKLFLGVLLSFISFFSGIFINITPVNAQEDNLLCRIFPFLSNIRFTDGLCSGDPSQGGTSAVEAAGDWVQFALSLVFVGIIAVAVFIIIKAAIKYIRSEGDEGQVEEATKAIKNVFIGIAALLIGVIGLVIILSVFSTGNILTTDADKGDNPGPNTPLIPGPQRTP